MSADRSKPQQSAGDNHSSDHSLTDAYHRALDMDRPNGLSFVLIFGDTAHQFNFRRGDPQSLIASRLREFADRLAGTQTNG